MAQKQRARDDEEKGESGSSFPTILIVLLLIPAAFFTWGFLKPQPQVISGDLTQHYSTEFLSSAIGPGSPAAPANSFFPHIVYEEGELYVRGVAANQRDIDASVARLEELFGEGNVIPELVIDPDFVADPLQATEVYFTENVLFESGSATIAPRFLDVLTTSAAFLQLSPETTITITGHTDSNGTEESNLTLSQTRVDNARQAMIDAGADGERLTAIGRGESEPIADNSTAEGRQANRRVELTIRPGEA